jgi:hypothetical protein
MRKEDLLTDTTATPVDSRWTIPLRLPIRYSSPVVCSGHKVRQYIYKVSLVVCSTRQGP